MRPTSAGRACAKLGGFEVVDGFARSAVWRCDDQPRRLVADCRIGKGEAIVIADADLLDVDRLGREARAQSRRPARGACEPRANRDSLSHRLIHSLGTEQAKNSAIVGPSENAQKSAAAHEIPSISHENPLYPALC